MTTSDDDDAQFADIMSGINNTLPVATPVTNVSFVSSESRLTKVVGATLTVVFACCLVTLMVAGTAALIMWLF